MVSQRVPIVSSMMLAYLMPLPSQRKTNCLMRRNFFILLVLYVAKIRVSQFGHHPMGKGKAENKRFG